MFDSVALNPSVLRSTSATKPAPRKGLVARLEAALESLVEANSRGFEKSEDLVYRFPPF